MVLSNRVIGNELLLRLEILENLSFQYFLDLFATNRRVIGCDLLLGEYIVGQQYACP